jgi:hypothetical protein
LQEILAAHPAEHLTFLATKAGSPFTAQNFTHWFRKTCNEAILPLKPHSNAGNKIPAGVLRPGFETSGCACSGGQE